MSNIPALLDLFKHPFQRGKTIIYSFYRSDRNFAGITLIKAPDGKFVRNKDSSYFNIPQLAKSVTDLPGYLKNGNTPQGIFSILGYYITKTESIGPTPIILTRIPFAETTSTFFHGQKKGEWNIEKYTNLMPESWRNYFPAHEVYYAGYAGRRLIVMHGSADDLKFFENEPYYPLSPTKGCISAKEIWDERSGICIESDQAKLINAFISTGRLKGFLIVINIDDKREEVTLKELLPYLHEAEK